jgi:two-component system cell cycle response regulator
MARILIIEDSASQRAELRVLLRESGLFEHILEAGDGLRGLKLLLSEPVDLVLCDLELPGLDGEKLLRMSHSAHGRQIPFLVLTSVKNSERTAQLLRDGACDAIIKPFHSVDLIARIELHLKLQRLQRELIEKNRLLEKLSTTDPLTGLRNRRFLTEILSVEFQRANRYGTGLTILMADLDRFKRVNDHYGHLAGDEVLSALAKRLLGRLRGSDVGGRYGGEEFMVMLSHVGTKGGVVFAERWRADVEETAIELDDGRSIQTTLSIGVASYTPTFKDWGELVGAADAALYRAKDAGRNQVAVYEPSG